MLSFFKSITFFTRSQKRGIIILLILIGAVLCSEYIIPELLKKDTSEKEQLEQAKAEKECEEFLSSLERDTKHHKSYYYSYEKYRKKPIPILAAFDPNTATESTLCRLGLPEWMVKNILKYRAKGGRFHKASDFKRVYGLTADEYSRLLPYINIKQDTVHKATQLYKPRIEQIKEFKYSLGTTVNLNLADTTELKKIPGIGSGIARLIVNYRQRLGGFYQIEQLDEIHLQSRLLRNWFTIHPESIRRINVNQASIGRLNAHPYINFYQAKAIVEYRRKKGKITSLKPFILYEEFTDNDFKRITPYVCFE